MRNHVLDAVKGIAAYFVVLLHIRFPGRTGEIVNVLARFAVPFFFMISGYFCYSSREGMTWKRLPGKLKHTWNLCLLAFPFYLVWQCIQECIKGKSAITWLTEVFTMKNLKELLFYNNTSFIRWHLWFLPALLYCYLFMMLIEKFCLHRVAYILVPVLLFGHFWMEELSVLRGAWYPTMEFRDYLFTGIPFFILGYYIHRKDQSWMKKPGRKPDFVLGGGMLLGAACSIFEYSKTGLLELFLGTVLFTVCLFLFCIGRSNLKVPKKLSEIGAKYAFSIYLLHLAVGDFWKQIAIWTGSSETGWYLWTKPVIVCILTTVLSVLLSKMKDAKAHLSRT